MKKIILTLLFTFGLTATMQAQFIRFGVKGGVNFANQTGDASMQNVAFDTKGITSYHAGVVAEIKLLKSFSIQPEILYSTQGASYKNALNEFKNELGYLSIPVMAKIYLSDPFYIAIGPQASFLLSQKNDFDYKDAKTFDFSANAGLGFKITKHFFIEGRYNLGLTEASKDAQVKNAVVQLSAGIMF